ncbi:MAG: hypothetical protein JO051_04280 [Acidobacteriaceae bacterium]|nr:hypothetical protein [Acidobacteriaceae bacterium]
MLRLLYPLVLFGFVFSNGVYARDKWTELNIGPFYVDTDGDVGAGRNDLTQLEQLRWVMGGLLESKDLPSLWPIRVMLTKSEKTNPIGFESQQGQYLLVCPPETRLPLDQVARILLDANTQRLPDEVEKGLPELFSSIEAHGAHVTWGGAPAHPDLAWARMQLFATKFEYSLSFHIFLSALRTGTNLRAAERNAFGKDPAVLEQEVAANLAAGTWQAVPVSGRPLDPKRDFGEHSLDETSAAVYLANFDLKNNPDAAEAAYKEAVTAGPPAAALGYEGLAALAERNHENPKPFSDKAIKAGSRSASVYVSAAEGLDPAQAMPLLKRAAILNPLWAEPVFREAALAMDKAEKLSLLKEAAKLDPRGTQYWIALAEFETSLGQASAAQGSWFRAEDSAATPAIRDRVHQQRVDSEQERLDAEAAANQRERDATRDADERAQQAEAGRIRAAERRANRGKDDQPDQVIPWSEVVPQKHLLGKLVTVECLGSNARLVITDRQGASVRLLLKNVSEAGLACGPQKPTPTVSLSYSAEPDERFQTVGLVTSLKVQ